MRALGLAAMLGCLTLCLEGVLQWVDFMVQSPEQPASSHSDASDEMSPAKAATDVEWLSEDEYRRRHGGGYIPIDEYRRRKAAGENLP